MLATRSLRGPAVDSTSQRCEQRLVLSSGVFFKHFVHLNIAHLLAVSTEPLNMFGGCHQSLVINCLPSVARTVSLTR